MPSPYKPHTERLRAVDGVVRMLLRGLPQQLTYHNAEHTLDPVLGVVAVADRLARLEGLMPGDIELVVAAAYFHDAGHIFQYQGHEERSAELAEVFLPGLGYLPEEVSSIRRTILASDPLSEPQTSLDRIIRDADVDNFGRTDFFDKGHVLRMELEIDDLKGWYQHSIRLLEGHCFFTTAARTLREQGRQENLRELKRKVEELERSSSPHLRGGPATSFS